MNEEAQYAVVDGYKYNTAVLSPGELRIYTVYLYPYEFGSTDRREPSW